LFRHKARFPPFLPWSFLPKDPGGARLPFFGYNKIGMLLLSPDDQSHCFSSTSPSPYQLMLLLFCGEKIRRPPSFLFQLYSTKPNLPFVRPSPFAVSPASLPSRAGVQRAPFLFIKHFTPDKQPILCSPPLSPFLEPRSDYPPPFRFSGRGRIPFLAFLDGKTSCFCSSSPSPNLFISPRLFLVLLWRF